jgi:hypothetical protein
VAHTVPFAAALHVWSLASRIGVSIFWYCGLWFRIPPAPIVIAFPVTSNAAALLEEKEAIAWLLRYDYSLPKDLEGHDAELFFVPGSPKPAAQMGVDRPVPAWNKDRGELSYRTVVVKRVRTAVATNVVKVLDVFQEEGWPDRIDDPLDPSKDQQRLHETIKRLNDNLKEIRFHADGMGQGIVWEATAPEPPPNSLELPF